MGCGLSDQDWQSEMEDLEMQLFNEGDIDVEKLTRKYTIIQMEGKDYAVRTCIYNDDKDKKTLLMTHDFHDLHDLKVDKMNNLSSKSDSAHLKCLKMTPMTLYLRSW